MAGHQKANQPWMKLVLGKYIFSYIDPLSTYTLMYQYITVLTSKIKTLGLSGNLRINMI